MIERVSEDSFLPSGERVTVYYDPRRHAYLVQLRRWMLDSGLELLFPVRGAIATA